ncbi:decaprenyl-phosphate phosphoribosyltransferase [Alcaligenaceae bacterium LF4-65]|uniref:Decaprenyl-phosphate phosphoribosyltransferase n=1 Tax=Zwartia hollandica TaxID=324606 RepID=A0A953NBB9_9BURK|nr:decaprenyl-phosphate phosphoribosyltransferase [Zwartia hollandica]MBZ1350145.1 decaprenyl-phosphate phosphoribosyltransferase [Zwartia hollandica]
MHATSSGKSTRPYFKDIIRLIRVKQWVKNGFVLAPLLFTGQFTDRASVVSALTALVLFCLASSATYIVNDLKDIDRDRLHPKKSLTRPLAAGRITTQWAFFILAIIYVCLAIGYFVEPAVVLVILGYIALNILYTFKLKHQPVLDIFTISLGFVLRVFAGAVALNAPVSGWMFITTLCLALYLAAVKRGQELTLHGTEGREVLSKYRKSLVDRYAEMSATCALVFYSMFVMASRPELMISVPFVLFGLFRYWYVVEMLDGGESPTDALLTDLPLIITIAAWCAACLWALWPN